MKWLPAVLALILVTAVSCANPNKLTLITRTTSCQGSIFIGGNVNNPGIYPYSENDLLTDLIRAAGGIKEGAETSEVWISFGSSDNPQKIDINRAEGWLLEALPDVGASTAKNIVVYREANGPFRNVNDLLRVPGIGPGLLDKITPYVVVGGD